MHSRRLWRAEESAFSSVASGSEPATAVVVIVAVVVPPLSVSDNVVVVDMLAGWTAVYSQATFPQLSSWNSRNDNKIKLHRRKIDRRKIHTRDRYMQAEFQARKKQLAQKREMLLYYRGSILSVNELPTNTNTLDQQESPSSWHWHYGDWQACMHACMSAIV